MALLRLLVARLLPRRSYSSQQLKLEDPSSSTSTPSEGTIGPDLEHFKSGLEPPQLRRLLQYMAEYSVFKENDPEMPSVVKVKNWSHLLQIDCKRERIRYLTYLYESEKKRGNERAKKEKARAEADVIKEKVRAMIEQEKERHIYYGFSGSHIFRRYMEGSINKCTNNKLAKAMVHGPQIVFDMSFYPAMRLTEANLTSKQLAVLYHENRSHRFPHHLVFTGCHRDHPSWKDLVERYCKNGFEEQLHTVTEKHYLELFPKESLVYLSPDANDQLEEYDGNKVYIIAAYVDKIDRPKVTLARALEEGIEARRLPLDGLKWMSKNALCLNHVLGIMNDAHAYGSVQAAVLSNLPARRILSKAVKLTQKGKHQVNNERMKLLMSLGPTTSDNSDNDDIAEETEESITYQ